MQWTIQNNVPRCPKCSAFMGDFLYHQHRYFQCNDCWALYQVIGTGKTDIELVISDEEVSDEHFQ